MPSFAFLESVWNESSMKTETDAPVVDGSPASHMGMTEGVDTRRHATVQVPDVPEPTPRARASHAKMSHAKTGYERRMDPSKRPLVGRVRDTPEVVSEPAKGEEARTPSVQDGEDVPELSVTIRNPKLVQYLEAYRDTYRSKVAEDMLLKSLKGSSIWDMFGMNGKEMFTGGDEMTPRERQVQMLMYLWIGIAVALFFLLITSG